MRSVVVLTLVFLASVAVPAVHGSVAPAPVRLADAIGPLPGGEGLPRAVAIAKAASLAEAKAMGLVLPSALGASHATPSAALEAFVASRGASVPVAQRAALARLDALPAPLPADLAALADAFAAYSAAARANDPAGVFAARAVLLDDAVALQRDLAATPPVDATPVALLPYYSIDLTTSDNTYTADVELLVDAGGNDTYLNNAGGSGVDVGCTVGTAPTAGALFDFAGNDRYGDPLKPRPCGVNGGGYYGAGLLLDAAGDDTYVAGDYGVNGGADTGEGLLVDAGGNDSYVGGSAGTNGGSAFGAGLLVDASGDDVYLAQNFGTNGGGYDGAGALIDAAGNDRYSAGIDGVNGGATLGEGLLLDLSGHDQYDDAGYGPQTDNTILGKGALGDQIDVPDAPILGGL